MSNILEKVRGLLARSTSTFEEEARSSAHLAAKLILKHSLVIDFPRGYRPPAPEPTPPANGVPREEAQERRERRQAKRRAKPPKPRTREELQVVAMAKCIRLVEFFEKRATEGRFPILSLQFILRKSVESGEIIEEERRIYSLVLGALLRALVKQGVLQSRMGSKGGYQYIVQEPPKEEPARRQKKSTKTETPKKTRRRRDQATA